MTRYTSGSEATGSSRPVEGAAPARIAEEVQHDVAHPGQARANSSLVVNGIGRDERPVIEQSAADDILPRHKSPIARIQAVVPIVAHHEVHAGRDHEVAIDDVVGRVDGPGVCGAAGLRIWRLGRKLVKKLSMVFRCRGGGVGLCLRHPIPDHDAIAQMDVVSGHADEALDEKDVLRLAIGIHRIEAGSEDRLDENNDVAVLAARDSAPAASNSRAAQG